MKNMNTAFILPEYPFGGAEKQAFRLAREGVKLGHQVDIIHFAGNKEPLLQDGVRIISEKRLDFNKKKYKLLDYLKIFRNILEINRILKTMDYDFYIIFNSAFFPLTLFKQKRRYLLSVRELSSKYAKGHYRLWFNRADLITTINLPSYINLKNVYEHVYLVNNIVDEKKVPEEIKITKRVLCVANLQERKNLIPAIKAVGKLENKGFTLNIAGRVMDNDYYERVRQAAAFYKNINFLGYLEERDLKEEYLKAEMLIHLGYREGTPNAILDAIQYKLPLICLDLPENISIIDNIDPFLWNEKRGISLTDKIVKLHKMIEEEPETLNDYMRYLKNKMQINYSVSNADKFYKLLKNYI